VVATKVTSTCSTTKLFLNISIINFFSWYTKWIEVWRNGAGGLNTRKLLRLNHHGVPDIIIRHGLTTTFDTIRDIKAEEIGTTRLSIYSRLEMSPDATTTEARKVFRLKRREVGGRLWRIIEVAGQGILSEEPEEWPGENVLKGGNPLCRCKKVGFIKKFKNTQEAFTGELLK